MHDPEFTGLIMFLCVLLVFLISPIVHSFTFLRGRMPVKRSKLSHDNLESMTSWARLPKIEGEVRPAIPATKTKDRTPEQNFEHYMTMHGKSLNDPNAFWTEMAKSFVTWFSDFDQNCVTGGSLMDGDVHWFMNGKLNVAYNCIDKHVMAGRGDQTAIIWEGDEPGTNKYISYLQLQQEVSRVANIMKQAGVKKGDVVTIYMPMIPDLAFVMLACCRIGAVHSIVFAGFSAESLRGRIDDCNSKWIFTSDEGRRGGRSLRLKDIVDKSLELNGGSSGVEKVFTYQREVPEGQPAVENIMMKEGRDVYMTELLKQAQNYAPCEWMDSEDPMFILYTSGSTGKPKGVLHTTGGYLVNAAMTTYNSFDIRSPLFGEGGDIYCCAADCGWITGHTYIVYGPLCLGTTTMMFESVPTYPNPYRYWDMIQKHKVTQFYTAPTAIRALMRFDTAPIADYDMSSLRVLGSVGEPINPEAWKWYDTHVGRGKCTIADTYWQTETGGHIGAPLPGLVPMKPGSCALPCPGIEFAVLDSATGKELHGDGVEGVLCIKRPWPSMARTVYGDHDRFMNVYLRPYPGYYFTGDGCKRDEDGYYTITGRVDDVINPSGHRIGTAEVESSLVATDEVSEAAVVGFPHEVKGEGICCYVILKEGLNGSDELTKKLKNAVRASIGPFATPDMIVFTDLPKTRSGKIMRRILRKVAAGESDSIGDTSTLADPSIVNKLIEQFQKVSASK